MSLTHLEQEIERAKKAHAARMARLRRKAAAEQKRIDDTVVELLREHDAQLYKRLAEVARLQLAAAPKRRPRGGGNDGGTTGIANADRVHCCAAGSRFGVREQRRFW